MGVLRIQIDDSNDMFAEQPATEIGRLLRKLAQSFEQDGGPDIEYTSAPLMDLNGNTCGYVSYDHDETLEPKRDSWT